MHGNKRLDSASDVLTIPGCFVAVADKKQEVFDEDLVAILHNEGHPLPEVYQLEYLHINSGTSAIPTATVSLRIKDATREGAAIGDAIWAW